MFLTSFDIRGSTFGPLVPVAERVTRGAAIESDVRSTWVAWSVQGGPIEFVKVSETGVVGGIQTIVGSTQALTAFSFDGGNLWFASSDFSQPNSTKLWRASTSGGAPELYEVPGRIVAMEGTLVCREIEDRLELGGSIRGPGW